MGVSWMTHNSPWRRPALVIDPTLLSGHRANHGGVSSVGHAVQCATAGAMTEGVTARRPES